MAEETTYSIEEAKSGRSSCKKCKAKIGKGELRLGVNAPSHGGDFSMQSWFHPGCFTLPRKLVKEGVTAESFVKEMLQDNTSSSMLDDEEERDKIIASIGSKSSGGGGGGGGGGGVSANDRIASIKSNLERIRKAQDDNDDDNGGGDDTDDKPSKKKSKTSHTEPMDTSTEMSSSERAKALAYEDFASMKAAELQDYLRWNKQVITGTKSEVLLRVLDGYTMGRLAKCPTCGEGKLKLDPQDDTQVMCTGYFDDSTMSRVTCFFRCPVAEAPRLKWRTEAPGEDEEEEEEEEGGGKKGGDGSPEKKLLEDAAKLEWGELKNPKLIKKAAADLLELCTQAACLDMPPESKARMEVGKLVLKHKTAPPTEMMKHLISHFGLVEKKAEKAQQKQSALSSVCNHPDNVAVMQAMLELGDLYRKEGTNRHAPAIYMKVAEAIKGLDYAINEDNAKGLGKGKNKVANIGASSADKIYEFVTTGTIAKLEEKRAAN